jgi:nucleoside 2-deoxyribosyltransferase
MDHDNCPFCGEKSVIHGGEILKIECDTCGIFQITREALEDLPGEKKYKQHLPKVSAYTRSRTINEKEIITVVLRDEESNNIPRITIEEIINRFPKYIPERVDRALINLAKMSKFTGDKIALTGKDWPIFYPDSSDLKSVMFAFNQLIFNSFIEDYGFIKGRAVLPPEVEVTAKGWNRIYEIEKGNIKSKQAFIAMWFNESMEEVVEKGFKQAIRDAGYEPLRIDNKEHNNKIDDEIVAEIRRSKFVVCDFTGNRGNVYFEAGLAIGLGLPVIWCCRSDYIDNLQFDTRQYSHIVWSNVEDLYKNLYNRIRATIT